MIGFVETNLARGEYTMGAFLDIEEAFNNVTTSSIENSLKNTHAPNFLVRFITHMLGNRLIRSNLGGCSIVKRATRCAAPEFCMSVRTFEKKLPIILCLRLCSCLV